MITPRKMLLSPSGRMGRKDFWVGLIIFTLLSSLFNFALQRLVNSQSLLAFLISIPFPFLVLHMTYCVYGKRLHDMGRSFWPLTGMIALLILVAIVVMLAFGGTEYLSEYAQYDRKEDIDPEEIERINNVFKKNLSAGVPNVYNIMASIIFIFTIWVGTAKSDTTDNCYGQPK